MIWAPPGPGGGYTLDPTMTLPPLNFAPSEAAAIAVGLTVSGPMPFSDAAQVALCKVVAAMSAAQRERSSWSRASTCWSARPRWTSAGPAGARGGGVQRRVLELDYADRQGAVTEARHSRELAEVATHLADYLRHPSIE